MIYLLFSETVQEAKDLPEIGSLRQLGDSDKFLLKALADFIFIFEGSKTRYLKNRYSRNGYQYTEEEKLIIALKAVPL